MSQEVIKIGALATLFGPYSAMGEDSMRGVDLALAEFGGKIAGKRVLVVKAGSNAIPDDAIMQVETLLDKHKVDFVIGPLSGNEGLALRDFAKTHPERAFINGIAGAQDMTLRDAAPNFYNFTTHGVQWVAGLGTYVYETLGYKRVATLAEDYSYPHGQIAGFTLEYCKAGGKISERIWTSLGTTDYSTVLSALPKDVDALFVALGGTDALNFLNQYEATGASLPLIGGSITVDHNVLGAKGTIADRLVGMVSSGPTADDNPYPAWQEFVRAYQTKFPSGLSVPSLSAQGYYINTKAALLALQQVNGDLSNGQARFKAALNTLEFDTPMGHVKLDHNRQAIGNNLITMVERAQNGKLYRKLVKVIPNVNQTLGFPESDYLKIGAFTRDNPPAC